MTEAVIRNQLSVARTALQAIAFGAGGDVRQQAQAALDSMESIAKARPKMKGCPYCDEGITRTRFNRLYQHQLSNGDEINCLAQDEETTQ